MDTDDFSSIKNVLATISAPVTFVLGAVGWHYKGVVAKVDELDRNQDHLTAMVSAHQAHVEHLISSISKLDHKVDTIIAKLDN